MYLFRIMKENNRKKDEWYEGMDLLNIQKQVLFQRLTEYIRKEQWELVYFLNWKDNNSQRYTLYTKELSYIHAKEGDLPRIELEKKLQVLNRTQSDIVVILQPLFHEAFTKVAKETPPGIWYNERVRDFLRFDLIFWEREVSSVIEWSREHYRLESIYRSSEEKLQIKLQKHAEEIKKAKEKVRLPEGHTLISNENYPEMAKILIQAMENSIPLYAQKIGIDITNTSHYQNFINHYLLYFLIHALIKEKLVFDIKSKKTKICLNGTIEEILAYFNKKVDTNLAITPIDIKRRLWNVIKTSDAPMDLSYQHATQEDIEQRELYLNTTYFVPYGNTSINDIRKEIMTEYNSQKWVREKCFEIYNPRYHLYKDHENKEKKHLLILQEYHKKCTEEDPHITAIIKEIEQKVVYLEKKRKECTKWEEIVDDTKGNYEHSLTEIQQKYLKRYKVPIQYRRIFGIVVDKLNNFYKTKSTIIKKSDEINECEFQRLLQSNREFKDFVYYSQNFITYDHINDIFDKKWSQKWSKRILEIKNICEYPEKYSRQQKLKEIKKNKILSEDQLFLDL